MKIVTVVGARPQFIKAAAVSRAFRQHNSDCSPKQKIQEVIVHTGQHYDANMSEVFFKELDIPYPDYNLEIGGGTHGAMTGRMIAEIEQVLMAERPDLMLIYGDTNSTLSGAISASKLHIPIAHVEAGLRSFNMRMPEEINRILSDRVSAMLFCPTTLAVDNLKAEGIEKGVYNVGDVMYDASLFYREKARQRSDVMDRLSLTEKGYVLVTCHRAENTDDSERLTQIVDAIAKIALRTKVVFPLHPRTLKIMTDSGMKEKLEGVELLPPVPFLDMVRLEEGASVIITDSGGVQKEACFYGVPCITMRDETEWIETVELGMNTLSGANSERIIKAFERIIEQGDERNSSTTIPYGDGNAAGKIISKIVECYPGI